eukprot:995761-Pelagomonas_calceolata.AAC.1
MQITCVPRRIQQIQFSYKTENANGDKEGYWLQNLAVRSIVVFKSTASVNKLVGVHNRISMQFASNFIGTLVVKSQLSELVKGMLNIKGPTNTQMDGMESYNFCTEFAE